MNDIAVKVRLSSPFLWQYGYWRAWEDVQSLLGEWGEFTYQVSEIHACVDVAGYPLDALQSKHFTRRGHVVRWHQEDALILDVKPETEADERDQSVVSVRYGEQEGLAFSPAAAHSVTIYNKPREIRLKCRDKVWFADIWKANGWNGLDPVTRIEARYERDILCEFGIETSEEAYQRLDEMWAYTTQKWMLHTIPKLDKRRATWPTSKWWELVQSTVFAQRDAASAQREHVHSFHEKRILSAILGYVESYVAWMLDDLGEGNSSCLYGIMSYIIQRAQRHYEERVRLSGASTPQAVEDWASLDEGRNRFLRASDGSELMEGGTMQAMREDTLTKLLLTVNEAAQVLSLSRSLVYDFVLSNQVTSIKVGERSRRIPVEVLKENIQSQIAARH